MHKEPQQSESIDAALLQDLPFGLLGLGADGRIASVNRTVATLLGLPEDGLLGHRPAELPEAVQRLLGHEPHLYHDVANHRWLRRERYSGNDGEQLLLVVDVSEQERLAEENARLHQQVEDLKLTDDLTGMPNRRAITQALELHVSRSRRYQNPLSVMLVAVNLQSLAGVHALSSDPVMLGVSRFLRDRLRWVDQIGRWEEDEFLLVLPETALEDASGLRDKILAEQGMIRLAEPYDDLHPSLRFGLACWSKGDDLRTLLRKATDDLRGNGG